MATPRVDTKLTFSDYAKTWLGDRRVNGEPLKARTQEHYAALLKQHLYPAFGAWPVSAITSDDVRAWHERMGKKNAPTLRAHCYGLLNAIMNTAVADGKPR